MYQGRPTASATAEKIAKPRQLRQPPCSNTIATSPTRNSANCTLMLTPRPTARPAIADTPGRLKSSLARISHTDTATAAATGPSSRNTWNIEMISGEPSTNSTANIPARRPNSSRPV
jgi:hypothetical protein